MLMEIIGVVIGFSVIMLLLSLLVTSLSQATQSVFRLRGRNLRIGLAAALAKSAGKPDLANRREAADLLNRVDDSILRRQDNPESFLSRCAGPAVSWLDDDSLKKVLREKAKEINESTKSPIDAKTTAKTIDDVVTRFNGVNKELKNRFKKVMRGISLAWAIVVAAVFQVSTPDLIQQLSTDPALRAQYVSAIPQTTGDTSAAVDAEQVEARLAELSRINITPMRNGRSFYTDGYKGLANIIGVLLTAILLTLGAPFWYSALETAVRWRDMFSPPKEEPEPGKPPANK